MSGTRERLLPVLAPALVAAYPAAFIWSANLGEVTLADGLMVVMLLAMAGALVHAAVWLVVRRRMAAATAAGVAALVNAALFAAILIAERLPILFDHKVAAVAGFFLASACWLWWRAGDRPGLARTMGIAMLALYGGLAVSVGSSVLTRRQVMKRIADVPALREEIATTATPDTLPDIYLLVVDTYGSADVLRSVYGVHNRDFRDSLRALGFHVPISRSNYSGTAWSLASLLNVAYLDTLGPLLDGRTRGLWPLYALSSDDRVTRLLQRLGYRSYIVPSVGWIGTTQHSRAKIHLTTAEIGPLRGHWMRGTLLYHVWPRTLAGRMLGERVPWNSRERVLVSFDGARQLIATPGPKFVLMHSMVSHGPFTVDERCDALASPTVLTAAEGMRGRVAYRGGVLCSDRLVLALVGDILAKSTRPPVILIQGDHGPRGLGMQLEGDAAAITAPQAVERFGVLGAYHLPGAPRLLADTVTPVNVMRAVLRHVFGAQLPALPDRSLHATTDRPYRFFEVPASWFADSARVHFGAWDETVQPSPQPLN